MGTKYEMIKVRGEGRTAFTHEGESFAVDAKSGIMEIPAFLKELAESHGFKLIKDGK